MLNAYVVGCFRFNGPLRQYFSLFQDLNSYEPMANIHIAMKIQYKKGSNYLYVGHAVLILNT